jgi:hypothetical protein
VREAAYYIYASTTRKYATPLLVASRITIPCHGPDEPIDVVATVECGMDIEFEWDEAKRLHTNEPLRARSQAYHDGRSQ